MPACKILRLRRVAAATCSPPPQCDNCFLPYGKFGDFSDMDSGAKRHCREDLLTPESYKLKKRILIIPINILS